MIVKAKHTRGEQVFQPPEGDAAKAPVLRQKNVRPEPRSALITNLLQKWLKPDQHHYLGFGGAGDVFLLLAACWRDPKRAVIFFANAESYHLINNIFSLFSTPCFLHPNIMGTVMAVKVFTMVISLPSFRTSAHLPDRLDYKDWQNIDNYRPKIVTSAPWRQHVGQEPKGEYTTVICPSGSSKDPARQRHLTPDECKKIVQLFLTKGRVILTSSPEDIDYYGLYPDPRVSWVTAGSTVNHLGHERPTDIRYMFRVINAADEVVSMDTYLKTYSLLCGIPTTVIQTRYNGDYADEGKDMADWIFLNKQLWPELKLAKIEELLNMPISTT